MEETVRQLPDGEELVLVYDPRASSNHIREAARATKRSDLPASPMSPAGGSCAGVGTPET